MCCISSHKALSRVRKRNGPFFAWKQLTAFGGARLRREYQYHPGWNRPSDGSITGLHVYRYKPGKGHAGITVRVRISPRHVLGAEPPEGVLNFGRGMSELEVSRLFIYKADWRKAGLP